jgi:hypothetical protein
VNDLKGPGCVFAVSEARQFAAQRGFGVAQLPFHVGSDDGHRTGEARVRDHARGEFGVERFSQTHRVRQRAVQRPCWIEAQDDAAGDDGHEVLSSVLPYLRRASAKPTSRSSTRRLIVSLGKRPSGPGSPAGTPVRS